MKNDWNTHGVFFIHADGKKLEAVCAGPAPIEAPTIVLLHEGLGCVELWQNFPQRLAEATGFGVFAYSRAGYGRSDSVKLPRPLDYMTREAMNSLPEVLNSLDMQRVVLCGHSDGASIAAIYTGSVQDHRVRGLIVIAPHFFTESMGLASIQDARIAYANTRLRDKLANYHKDVDNAFRGWNDAWLDPEFVAWNIEEVIDYIRVPVLAIQGSDDQYGTAEQITVLNNRLYSPLEVSILADCRHSPHRQQTDQTLQAVSEFVKRLARIESIEAQHAPGTQG